MKETVTEFKYDRKFKDLSQEDVFDRIYSWLDQEGAEISVSQRPTRIEAYHISGGSSMRGRNARKRFIISLSGTDEGTCVEIVASPASEVDATDVIATQEETRSLWEMLSEELWKHVEGSGHASTGGRYWSKERSLSVLNRVAGIRIMIGGIILVVIGLLAAEAASGAVFVSVIGLLTIIWGAFKYWFGSRKVAR